MSSSSTSVFEGASGSAEDPEATSRRTEDQATTDQSTGGHLPRRSFSGRAPNFVHHPPALARHRRKCQICHHPDRELIEDLFIHWHSPNSIANFINSASDDDDDPSLNENNITWVAIYRHAYALGLDEIRRRNLRFAFELILEQAGDITPTSASIMAAARAYAACVNTDGQWNDPPRRVIVTNILKREAPLPAHETQTTAHEPADAAADESATVGAALRRPPSRSATTDVIPNPAASFADGGEGSAVAFASTPSMDSPAQEPSTHCHSERGCDQHPTRNLHFSGLDQASTGEIRNSANSLEINENTFSNR